MKILVLDVSTLGDDLDMSKLKSLGEVITYPVSDESQAMDRMKEHNPDIVITNKVVIGDKLMEAAPALKMIAETATGYNNIDLDCARKRNIRVANVAGYSTDSVIQHTFALAFYILEKLNYYDNYVKSGKYSECPIFTHFSQVFPELKGKTWGIAGLGNIGRGVADIAHAFGCRVIVFSASGNKYDSPYEQVDFDTLLNESDIISIHAPLNNYTLGLFDRNAFEKMKNSAILVNVGRGPIVADEDLAYALENNLIAGAALDVIDREPIEKNNPLLGIKDSNKLIITPHIAWATYEARTRLLDEVCENIISFMKCEERNVIV
ncbi:MAG: D-2-hydroxyacid dehydrogenase [Lachnospira sp.]